MFTPLYIKNIALKNRIVRSATHAGYADENGFVTDELVDINQRLARGGVGLIISGHAFVSPEGQASPRQLGVYSDECIPGLAKLAEAVHREGSKIFLQIAHAGCMARKKVSGYDPIGPTKTENSREANSDDIEKIIVAFQAAANRAEAAGFDGIQIHAAHGYLLSQFLSPYYNHRTDNYGGSLENRMRLLIQVIQAIRKVVDSDLPVAVKINAQDFIENGFTQQEMVATCKALEEKGIDCIEISGGTIDSGDLSPIRPGEVTQETEGYYREAAIQLREGTTLPIILVGGFRSLEMIQTILEQKIADCVALSRPLIREPNLIDEWKRGRHERARCISCNQCFRPLMTGRGLYCVLEKRAEKTVSDYIDE